MAGSKVWKIGALAGLLVLVGLGLLFAPGRTAENDVSAITVYFIDVGQGDSILIHDENNFDVLIDGGKSSAGPDVLAFLRSKGIDDIDVMVATHADADHIGGLIDVLEATDIPVEQVLYNGYPGTSATWTSYTAAVANEGLTLIPAQFPLALTWGGSTAYILNPAAGMSNPDTNDASVVVLLAHGANRYLFTGDIDGTVEATVAARLTPVAADVLKVSHHGSAYSSSASFLSAVQPDDAVISVGVNSYGHPSADTLSRLVAAGAEVWRTDLDGSITVEDDGLVYVISSENGNGYAIFLPAILRPIPPTATPTATATSTATIPAGPTDTPGKVEITDIFADGAGSQEPDEYVQFENTGGQAVQLQGWTLQDNAGTTFTFPSYLMQPGQVCRVYTNEVHPEYCGFSYGRGSAIWNNTGDCAYLRDAGSVLQDQYCY